MPNENDGYNEALFGKREQAPMLKNIPVRADYDEGFGDPRLFDDLPVHRQNGEFKNPTPTEEVTHAARVKIEREELALKIDALRAFMRGELYPTLTASDQNLLTWQESAMCTYLSALDQRIAAWAAA